MKKNFVLFLAFFLVLIFSFTAKKLSACSILEHSNNTLEIHSAENYVFSRCDYSHGQQEQKRFQDFSRRSENFNVVFSKSDSIKILENIEFQRLRNSALSEKNNSTVIINKASEQTASTIHQYRLTSIHQDINQRK